MEIYEAVEAALLIAIHDRHPLAEDGDELDRGFHAPLGGRMVNGLKKLLLGRGLSNPIQSGEWEFQ